MEAAELALSTLKEIAQGPLFVPIFAIGTVFFAVLFGAYHVMTARPRAEEKYEELVRDLAALKARLEEAEHVGGVGSFAWDFEDPRRTFWTREVFELFGMYPRAKPPAVGELGETVHEADREKFKETWLHACTEPGDFSFVIRTLAASGEERHIRMQGKTEMKPDHMPRVIHGLVQDVTKEIEVDRAKTEFVSLASHQLKTPLTSINWVAENLLTDTTLSAAQRTHIGTIHEAGMRMVSMVNDLLNVSRLEMGTLQFKLDTLDACALLDDALSEQRPTAERKNVSIAVSCGEIPPVMADKNLLRMVMQNLISNAIKYTPSGGKVSCEMSMQGTRDKVYLSVSDTGIGIPKNEHDKVFQKLHRAKNAQEQVPDGTGLGLYLVKIIIERAGGVVTFESAEGKGTTFHASFPQKWQTGDNDVRVQAHRAMLQGIWQKLEKKRF